MPPNDMYNKKCQNVTRCFFNMKPSAFPLIPMSISLFMCIPATTGCIDE